jgi:heptosyltransferase-2/heptosyltransferase-3
MGDMVIALTLTRMLHQRFNAPVDVVTTGNWARPLLQSQPGVGEVYLLPSRRSPYWLSLGKQRLVAWLRRRGAGPTWICNEDERLRRLVERAGIASSWVMDESSCPRFPGEHAVDRWARFARLTPDELTGKAGAAGELDALHVLRVPPLQVLPAWRHDADRWLASRGLQGVPLILVQAGNKRTMRWLPRRRRTNTKYWPEQRWAEVVDRICAAEPTAHLLLLGVREEAGLNNAILKQVCSPRARNVAGDVPIPRLLALQERAAGMISVDTGPAHSAAALACPLVVLFGLDKTSLYSPRSATGAVEVLIGNVHGVTSMLGIQPDHVLDAWERLRR